VTTTNWSQAQITSQWLPTSPTLSPAVLKVLETLNLHYEELPILDSNQPEQNPDKTNSLE
jgi:hypothetical protein